jgi:DHA1 family multidrug resistance protein-like MFS transporter
MKSNRNISILFFSLIVVMLGFGMVIPIMPFYVKSLGASGSALGMLMAVYGLMQFIFAPLWGQLSDRVGRRKIIMIGVLGNALAQLFFGLSSQLWMLFASRALAGILSSATLPTAMAYISDSTEEKDRGGGMGALGAAMGIGMVLGPGLGGWLADINLSFPYFVAAALSFLALLIIYLVLPESLPPERRQSEPLALHGPRLGVLWGALRGPLGFLLLMAFLLTFGLTNFEGVFGLYSADRYGYDAKTVGWILTLVGITSALMQGLMTGPLTRRFGEAAVIKAALLGSALGFFLMTRAENLPALLATVSFFIVSNAMLNPANSSLISRSAQGGQGMMMGLNNSFQSLGRIAGPLWAGLVFDINMQLPYLTGMFVMLLAFVLSLIWLKDASEPREFAETLQT